MADLYASVASALMAKLAADSSLQAVLGNPARVHDQRPAMATFPYLVLGESEARDISTKTVAVTSQLISLQVFSRQRSGAEARLLMALMRDALHDASLTLASGSVARCQEEYNAVRWDEEMQAARGFIRYRVIASV